MPCNLLCVLTTVDPTSYLSPTTLVLASASLARPIDMCSAGVCAVDKTLLYRGVRSGTALLGVPKTKNQKSLVSIGSDVLG